MKLSKLILSLCCGIVIIGFLLYKLGVFESLDANNGQINTVEEYKKREKTNKKVVAEEKKENKNGMNKEKLVLLILDSSLHFDDVQGEFTLDTPGETQRVKYALDMVNLKEMQYRENNNIEFTRINLLKTKKTLQIDHKENTYRCPPLPEDKNRKNKSETYSTFDRIVYGFGNDPRINAIAIAEIINSRLVQNLKYYNDWEYEETIFMDMPVYRTYGIATYIEHGEEFEMIIEKNTGIILYFLLFDTKGNEIMLLTTESIQINEGIDDTLFEYDVTGYEKVGTPDYVPEEYLPDNYEEYDEFINCPV